MQIQIPIWKRAPFIRLIIPMLIGILFQWYLRPGDLFLAVLAAILITAVIVINVKFSYLQFQTKIFTGVLTSLLVVCFAAANMKYNDQRVITSWYGHNYTSEKNLIGTIAEEPIKKPRSYKFTLEVNAFLDSQNLHYCKGKVLVYVQLTDSFRLHYGDQIIFNKPLQRIKNSGNPGAFNFKQYAEFNGLFHQVYLKETEFIKYPVGDADQFTAYLHSTKSWILNNLRKHIHGNAEIGIAEALLIGYKEDLDKDLVKAYSATGVVHIIAISGLHLGLIYVMLVWICAKIPFVKKSPVVKMVIILSCLWMFSLLTGASASVLRSAVMFSCILAGDCIGKKSSIYNSLAASAFILLSYNPYLLWDAGFQLSYLALLGIVIFQKPISRLIYIKYKWLRKIWELTAVSLAAQTLTFPICIYYFHQFPNIFLITNLVTVPLSSVILFAEIFLLCISWFAPLAYYAGKVITCLIWLMNEFVMCMKEMPYSAWENLYISFPEMIMWYSCIISLSIFILKKWQSGLILFTACGLIISIIQLDRIYNQTLQSKIVVYNIPKVRAIDIFQESTFTFLGDSLGASGPINDLHIKPARLENGAMNASVESDAGKFIEIKSKRFLLLDTILKIDPVKNPVALNAIIISHNPRLNITELLRSFNPECIIIDASNSLWKIEKWKKECEALHLRCHIIPKDGAFIMNL